MSPEPVETSTLPPDEGAPPRRRRRLRWAVRVVTGLLLLLAVLFLVVTETGPGQRWLVGRVADRIGTSLGGTVSVESVRSTDLLEGVRLYGVAIDGPDGEPFLRVDSVRATYFWPRFLTGDIVLSSLVVHGPHLRIARAPGEEASNLARLFGSTGAEPGAPPERRRSIILRGVRVRGGSLEVLTPFEGRGEGEGDGRAVVVEGPGGPQRRITLEGIEAALPRLIVTSPRVPDPEITVDSLSFVARIFEDAFRLAHLAGVARWKDGRLSVDATELRLPGSEASGTLYLDFAGEEGLGLGFRLETPRVDLADLAWTEPRIPAGTARGRIGLDLTPAGMSWSFTDAEVRMGTDRVQAEGTVQMGAAGTRFGALDLTLEPLDLARADPWLGEPLPLSGTVRGQLRLDGPLDGVRATGRLELEPEDGAGAPTVGDFDGILHLTETVGATAFHLDLDPLEYALLGPLLGDSVRLEGTGRLSVDLTGRLRDGLRFGGEAVHQTVNGERSRVLADGSVRRGDEGLVMDIQGDLAPFSLVVLKAYRPDLAVEGTVAGSVRARGPLSDLLITASLSGEQGSADVEGRLNLLDPGSAYRLEGDVRDVDPGAFMPRIPEGGGLNAHVALEGSGLALDSARIRGSVWATSSTVAALAVDTAALDFELADGLLTLDTVTARAGGVELQGGGALAVRTAVIAPEFRVHVASDSLSLLRPFFMGENLVAKDTLSTLEWEVLAMEGIDPETLPDTVDVAMRGRAQADVVFHGSLDSLGARGSAWVEDFVYRKNVVEGARLTFDVADVLGGRVPLSLTVQTDSVLMEGRGFASGTLDVAYGEEGGWVAVEARRGLQEDYAARGYLRLDSVGGSVDLDSLHIRLDSVSWRLARPGRIQWDGEALRMDTMLVSRGGDDPMEIRAAGVLPRGGAADFTLDAEAVHLDRLARLAQREDLGVSGEVDISLRITGTAASPVMDGTVTARELAYESWDLSRVDGDVGYRDGVVYLDLDAWRGGVRVLQVDGTVPADLALGEVADRFPADQDMDVTVVADSLPAAFALTPVAGLEDVRGTVAGSFQVSGTVEDPAPSGTLVMQNAGWRIPALGAVRYDDVEGTLTVSPEGLVDVDARARSVGTVAVTGTVGLEPLNDPTFDLILAFDGFQAVNRRDVTGRVSGDVTLGGTFRRPVVRGRVSDGRGLRVDEGVLYLEEFRRSVSVVDLSDPRFVDLVMDTVGAGAEASLPGRQNPFLQNLRVDVSLAVERNTWLRSPDLNVEIGGDDLTLTYDRGSRDLVLVGSLQAIRGSYSTLGRRFDVTGGTVEFVGIPGINPDLDIQARTRVRRTEGEALEISATVSGTLMNPQVQLASEERALGESDLVSYLVFGRPTYELTSGQAGLLSGATGGLASFISGSLSNQISALVAQQWGLDYFAINQPGQIGGFGTGGQAAQTSVEVGRYLSEDFFAVLVVRPLFQAGGARTAPLGVRLEWQASDLYRVEGFLDDRFLRSGAFGFRELGFSTTMVVGFSVLRDWAY